MTTALPTGHFHPPIALGNNFFSDFCLRFAVPPRPTCVSQSSSFAIAHALFKVKVSYSTNISCCVPNNGVTRSQRRSRLHHLGCTNLEKNSTNFADVGSNTCANYASAAENDGNAKCENGFESLEKMDGAHHLDCTNLDKNSANLNEFGSNPSTNCTSTGKNDGNQRRGNGLESLEEMDRGNQLGCTNLQEKGSNLSGFRSKTVANAICENKSVILEEMDKGEHLACTSSDESRAKFANFGSKASANLTSSVSRPGENDRNAMSGNGSAVLEEIDGKIGSGYFLKEGTEDSSENRDEKEQSENLIINRILSPYSFDPFKLKKDNGLLSEEELEKLKILENFEYNHRFEHGLLVVKVMGTEHMLDTEELLVESFAELMWGPLTYRPLLRLTVRQHMLERRAFIPHVATLVALYAEEDSEMMLAGTVELSFDSKGSAEFPPTPIPPKAAPYLCNMAVNKSLRRRGIGWQLLKASEELVPQVGSRELYLHCRIIDTAPFNIYKKAGYNVVQTDNLLTLLTLQRRRHLMYKKFPEPTSELRAF